MLALLPLFLGFGGVPVGSPVRGLAKPPGSPRTPYPSSIELAFSSGRHTFSRTIGSLGSGATAGDLLREVSLLIGIKPDFLVLWKGLSESRLIDKEGRVKNRRNSDRIGWNSMWPDADKLNEQTLEELGVKEGGLIHCAVRPLRGDHIHQAFAAYVHGELVDIIWDQEWLGTPDANEGDTYPSTFANLSAGMYDYHITTTHPHFGMHAGQAYWFGDGLIHSHPGTSWQWFHHTEGLGATLGAFLEQTGVALYDGADSRYPLGQWHVPFDGDVDLDQNAMTFPDNTGGKETMVGGQYACEQNNTDGKLPAKGLNGQNVNNNETGTERHTLRDFQTVTPDKIRMTPENIIIGSNATHKWRAYYWDYFNETAPRVIEYGMTELWLGENLGMVVLSFERRDANATGGYVVPRPPQCMIDVLADKVGFETGTSMDHQQSSYYTMGFDGYSYPMPNDHGYGWPWSKKKWITENMTLGPLL